MAFDNTFYATVALVIFIGLALYFGIHTIIAKMLDKQIQKIADDLAEAKKLREEAAALLVEYEQKRVAAESEAEGIADLIARRTKSVEDKIAQAEAQAVSEVRARSADIAIEAARLVLTDEMNRKGGQVVDKAIADVGNRLN